MIPLIPEPRTRKAKLSDRNQELIEEWGEGVGGLWGIGFTLKRKESVGVVKMLYNQWFLNGGPRPTTEVLAVNLLNMKILRPCSRLLIQKQKF